ncbi:uncharacterized protein LOC127079030 [Lathyrus oleraceus]|uniref:uncharacterized protein LOC127079030 n=1 Tax=Pisum sativum TaxID=3888 RepID=UPI0021D05598|nr:uncharacterized protein LOC127079030 [Pisum sativum]
MVTPMKLSKDLNNISLEALINSLRSNEIELEEDKPQKKRKFVALKSKSERRKSERNKVFQDEEEEADDSENEDSDNEEELSLISIRITKLWIKSSSEIESDSEKVFSDFSRSDLEVCLSESLCISEASTETQEPEKVHEETVEECDKLEKEVFELKENNFIL